MALRNDNENWARDEAHADSARKGDAHARENPSRTERGKL